MRSVIVVDYDSNWPERFEQLRAKVWTVVNDFALGIEHVGSTSVPGLAAKPIIDMSVVVSSAIHVPVAIDRVARLGYVHLGDLDVEGREAFQSPHDSPPHNLYVCPQGSLGLVNQLAARDYLRAHPDTARAYGDLKKKLAIESPHDIESYVYGKTDFILELLQQAGLSRPQLEAIERVNRRSNAP